MWDKIEREQKIKEVNEYMDELHKARDEYKRFRAEYQLKHGHIYIPPERFDNDFNRYREEEIKQGKKWGLKVK